MSKHPKSNSIRLIAGKWRGTRLPVIDSEGLRPSTDRVRETLFNWLMHDIRDAACLDLFAGSGALGLECLSRGAQFVQFIESDLTVAQNLSANLQRLGVESREADLRTITSEVFLTSPPTRLFDVVFLDPPFNKGLLAPALLNLERGGWLSANAMIYLEYSAAEPLPVVPESWQPHKSARAGQTSYALFIRNHSP